MESGAKTCNKLSIKCKTVNHIKQKFLTELSVCWKTFTFFTLCKNLDLGRGSVLAELPPWACWAPIWELFGTVSVESGWVPTWELIKTDWVESSSASSVHKVSLTDRVSLEIFGSSLGKSSSSDSRGGLQSAKYNVQSAKCKGKVQSAKCNVQSAKCKVQSAKCKVQDEN